MKKGEDREAMETRFVGPGGHWVELAFTESELKFCVKE